MAVAALGSILVTYVAYRLTESSGGVVDYREWIGERVRDAFGGFGALFSPSLINKLVAEYPLRTVALLGAAGTLFPSRLVAMWAYARFFDTMDPRVLLPPPPPERLGLEPEERSLLPWLVPPGARQTAWDELTGWMRVGDRFSWHVLYGPSGTGKTRTAFELGQAFAAGSTPAYDLGAGFESRPRSAWHGRAWRSASAYVRTVLRRPADSDPWDVGVLSRAVREGAWAVLVGWRPRRRTLLILDDPYPGESARLVETLTGLYLSDEGARLHPVRVLIVGQTIPEDLGIRLDGTRWERSGMAVRVPTHLSDAARFSPESVIRLAHSISPALGAHMLQVRACEYFMNETQGNPLLVELGLEWLRQKQPLDELSKTGLLAERAKRVRRALEAAAVRGPGQRAVAAATVCGGGRVSVLEATFGTVLTREAELARVFPPSVGATSEFCPPIGPKLIGDAFVRLVIDDSSDIAADVVRAAWHANPTGTLRSMLRVGSQDDRLGAALRAGPVNWSGSRLPLAVAYAEVCTRGGGSLDDARRELRQLTPEESRAALSRLAGLLSRPGAHGDAGLLCFCCALENAFRDGVGATIREVSVALRETAGVFRDAQMRGIAPLESYDAVRVPILSLIGFAAPAPDEPLDAELLDAIAALGEAAWDTYALHFVCGADILDAVVRVTEGQPGVDAAETQRLKARAAAMRLDPAEACPLAEGLYERFLAGEATPAQAADACRSLAWILWQQPWFEGAELGGISERVRALPNVFTDPHIALAYAWIEVSRALLAALSDDEGAESCQKIALDLEGVTASHPGHLGLTRAQVQAWIAVTAAWEKHRWGIGADACAAAARQIDHLTALAPLDHEMRLDRASAWSQAASAYADQLDGEGAVMAESLAEKVEGLCAPFRGDRGFDLACASAWGHACRGWAVHRVANDPQRAGRMAEQVEAITTERGTDLEFVLTRVRAQRCVITVRAHHRFDQEEIEAMARRVDAEAARFPDEFDLALERVRAWRCVAAAYERTKRADRAEEIAERVKALATDFADHAEFAVEQAHAWDSVAIAAAVGAEDADRAVRAARRAEEVLSPFGEDQDFAFLLCGTWNSAGLAASNSGGNAALERAEAARSRIEALAAPYAGNRFFEMQHVMAWNNVANALLRRGGEDVPARIAKMAEHVDALSAPFPGDESFVGERLSAWEKAAKASTEVGPGMGDRVQEIAERVERLAQSFPDNADHQWYRAQAWSHVVHARVDEPDGAGVDQAEEAAARIEAVAAVHRSDRRILSTLSFAWVTVIDVLADQLDGGQTDRAETIARRMDEWLAPYSADSELAFLRTHAWRRVSCAYTHEPAVHLPRVVALTRKVEEVTGPFLDDGVEFRIEYAHALAHLAWAYASASDGAHRARSIAEQIDELADGFAADTKFHEEQVSAWCATATGFSRKPQGEESAIEAAERADTIAALGTAKQKIDEFRATAWRSIACSFAESDPARAAEIGKRVRDLAPQNPLSAQIRAEVRALRICLGP